MQTTTGNIVTKGFKIIGWISLSIILLLVLIILLIQVPAVQLKLTQKAVSFLEKKIGTDVSLKNIHIAFPKNIVLEGIYLEDQKGDTLLYAAKLSINTDLWALTENEIQLNEISLENAVAFIDRPKNDSAFNFTYILDAFTDSTAVQDTVEQKNWDFSVGTVALENIRVNFDDLFAGNLVDVKLGNFKLVMDVFDLTNNTYSIRDISLSHSRADIEQTKVPAIEVTGTREETEGEELIFSLKEFTLNNIDVNYRQSALGQYMTADLGEIRLLADNIDLPQQEIDLQSIILKETFIAYHQRNGDSLSVKQEAVPADEKKDWKISLAALEVSNNSLQYYDFTKPREQGLDFNHIWITKLNIDARDLLLNGTTVQADLRDLSLNEKSGFSIASFSTRVYVAETGASLRDFLLKTPNSRLEMEAETEFSSLENLDKTLPNATVSATITSSSINVRDIRYFIPAVLDSLPVNLPPATNLRLDVSFSGSVDSLNIDHLTFGMLADTYLSSSGTVLGLPDTEKLQMKLALHKLYTTKTDLEEILTDTVLPDSLQLPAWLNLEGTIHGTLERASFNAVLTSNAGSIDAIGKINLDSTSVFRGYEADIAVNNLDLGYILMEPDSVMGKLTMTTHIQTTGLTPDEMNGVITVLIKELDYQGYLYKALQVEGNVRKDILSIKASMDDNNLDFTMNGDYYFGSDVPKYNLMLELENVNFQALKFTHRPLKARGIFHVDLATSDFKILNGNIDIRDVGIFDGDELYAVDSLLAASIDQQGKSEIQIDSDLLTAHFQGSINIFNLPRVMREYFHTYYSLNDSLDVKDAGHQHFTFDIQLRNTDLLTGILIPQLTSFVPGEITGSFDSRAQKLDLKMDINEIQYANIHIDSFVFRTNSNSAALNYNFFVDEILVDSMRVDGLEFNGTVANDSILTELVILDSAEVEKYVLAGTFHSREKGFELNFLPGRIKLNYESWRVSDENFMLFGDKKFVAQNVEFANGPQRIIIESLPPRGSPVYIGFRALDLGYLSSVVAGKEPLSGLLEGGINLYTNPHADSTMTFTSDIRIDDFQVSRVPWGDVSLAVEQKISNRFDVNLSLKGAENQVTARGFYRGGSKPAMNVATEIERFNLVSLQPLLSDQLENLTGILSGRIVVRGTPLRPDIDGSVKFNDAHFLSTYLNSSFTINDETIYFIDEGISLEALEIIDENNNTAEINGLILTNTYRDFRFRLDLSTNNFQLLNTTEGDNELFYGKIEIGANATIRGTMATPIIDLTMRLSEESHLTYIVPQSQASVLETEGIVEFVDKSFEGDRFMESIQREVADTLKATFRGIDLTAKIELSDEQAFTIVIDPITQDQLTIRGNSTLTLQIDPTGDIHLTGRYEISEGTYHLSFYKFVKREFTIESGSVMTWSGDPLNAAMDVRAIYRVETSPLELFSNQLTGADPTETNQYKQRLPFFVYLNITGQLLQPEISFQLDMPMEERNVFNGNVYARIQDINTRESDLNKQVFALLILKRFIADNPFENPGGGGFETTARRSVSKILSEQLNRLSENIKGVELSFDIKSYEDYSSGQGQTELELGVSKSLFQDRLVVKLSGNIDIEGENANREATDYIGDIAIEYKLTPDGRFRITGFRNSNYDMIDGELIETGAGFIYVKDYNALSELFKANAETKN